MFRIGKLVSDIDTLLQMNNDYETVDKRIYSEGTWSKVQYINLSCSFDIEVSSFYEDEYGNTYSNKYYNSLNREQRREFLQHVKNHSLMYIWQFGINGNVVVGRTWEEFSTCMSKVIKHFGLNANTKVLPIYVHNLAYEFQFIRKLFEWVNIFARETRSPMKALTDTGLEFRCSYMLSGCSLEQTCKNLTKYKVSKKVGDLDYDVLRTPLTPLTVKEIGYAIYDVIGVMCYIQEQIEEYGDVTKIPMTNTGRVRMYCREHCFDDLHRKSYTKLIESLKITNINEYKMLKRAFQGGFTHASWINCAIVHDNVKSFDFTSSYPTVMVAEKFPMSSATHIAVHNVNEMKRLSKGHCLIFDVRFKGLKPKFKYEHYLSLSQCYSMNGLELSKLSKTAKDALDIIEDNGRLIQCNDFVTTMTDIDFSIVEQCYEWESIDFGDCISYIAEYLPTPFVQCILDFYEKKTTLKDVVGFESEYLLKKGMLNSAYGMTVTDIITDIIEYQDELWGKSSGDPKKQLEDYNKSRKRFLYYPWGVFVTAYARRNLWTGIIECSEDYIYSDTDSIKILNWKKHEDYINKYNEWITDKLTKACEYHNICIDMIKPKTVKGKEKPLGVWDDDGDYRRFKTLGAKRYLVEYYDNDSKTWKLKCTIAGSNKKKTSEWLMMDYDNAFNNFDDFMEVPQEYSGRLVASYIDDVEDGYVVGDDGLSYHYHELSGVHMRGSEYNLTMTPMYLALLHSKDVVEGV